MNYVKAKSLVLLTGFFGGILFLTNPSCAADTVTNSASQINKPSPLKIIVTPRKKRVHLKEPFSVSLEVKNVSNTNRAFSVMSCSWHGQWKSDNPAVQIVPWNCLMNYPMTVSLAPGQSFTEQVNSLGEEAKIQITATAATNKVSFRMGFTPLVEVPGNKHHHYSSSGQTYWSDEVTVAINPRLVPDWISW